MGRPFGKLVLIIVTAWTTWVPEARANTVIPSTWTSQIGQSHPLAGKIYNGAGQSSSSQLLISQASLTRFVLLGEIHDNPDHHQIQANIIEAIAGKNHRPSVVLEMVPQRLAEELAKFDLSVDPRLDDLAQRLEWAKRGWPSWDIYRPVALAAARNNLPMVAGNLDRPVISELSRTGADALSGEQRRDFALTDDLPDTLAGELGQELQTSHCNLLPAESLPAMLLVQRARDGVMADAMIRAGYRFGSILIAGNGHIRKDWAVPRVLRQRLPGNKIVDLDLPGAGSDGTTGKVSVRIPNSHNLSIAVIEVEAGMENPGDYRLNNLQGTPLYDFVIFTPKSDDTDHCAALREKFKPIRKAEP